MLLPNWFKKKNQLPSLSNITDVSLSHISQMVQYVWFLSKSSNKIHNLLKSLGRKTFLVITEMEVKLNLSCRTGRRVSIIKNFTDASLS